MNEMTERRVIMPNGRRQTDSEYDPLWCSKEHERINQRFNNLDGPDGYITRVHKRIDNLWYLLVAIGIVGVANLIATLAPK